MLWLPTGVVLAIVLWLFDGAGLGGSVGPLELAQLRFNFIYKANVVVVLHDFDLRIIVRVAHCRRPQVNLRHVRWLNSDRAQPQREGEEDHPERHHKARLTHKGADRREEGVPPFSQALGARSLTAVSHPGQRPRADDTAGSDQNVVDQMRRRFDVFQRPEPLPPSLHVREQRTANRAGPPMSFEYLLASWAQLAVVVHGLAEQRVELGAFDPVFCFTWHQITCLYVRCRRRASSARPRLILDLTVPSGTLRAVAISR